jgi:hypothetical protein
MGKIADKLNEDQRHKDLYEEGRKHGRNYDYHDKGTSFLDDHFGSDKDNQEKRDNKEAYDRGYEQGNKEHDEEYKKK